MQLPSSLFCWVKKIRYINFGSVVIPWRSSSLFVFRWKEEAVPTLERGGGGIRHIFPVKSLFLFSRWRGLTFGACMQDVRKILDFSYPTSKCPHFNAASLTGFPYLVCFCSIIPPRMRTSSMVGEGPSATKARGVKNKGKKEWENRTEAS